MTVAVLALSGLLVLGLASMADPNAVSTSIHGALIITRPITPVCLAGQRFLYLVYPSHYVDSPILADKANEFKDA